MAMITLKNIPDEFYQNIKRMAKINHRSMNSEIICCLEKELMFRKMPTDRILDRARELRLRYRGKTARSGDIAEA